MTGSTLPEGMYDRVLGFWDWEPRELPDISHWHPQDQKKVFDELSRRREVEQTSSDAVGLFQVREGGWA